MPRVTSRSRAQRGIERPARWKLVLRRQRRLLRPTLLIAGITASGALLVGGMQTLVHGESLGDRFGRATAMLGLRVEHVRIDGRQKTPEPLLRAAVGIAPGDPLLTYSLSSARERIESIQWVQNATVERRLPDTIAISVTERRPFAVWQHEGKFVLIDRDGDMVTDSDVATFASQLPLVVGAGAPKAAATLLDALAAQPSLQPRIVAAVRVGERRWNLHLTNGTDVLLPEAAAPQALARLVALQAEHRVLDRSLALIDLRLPDRLVFRPAPVSTPVEAPLLPRNSDARRPT